MPATPFVIPVKTGIQGWGCLGINTLLPSQNVGVNRESRKGLHHAGRLEPALAKAGDEGDSGGVDVPSDSHAKVSILGEGWAEGTPLIPHPLILTTPPRSP